MADTDKRFQEELLALIPSLRAFSRTMAGDRAEADDLVQDTMLKAWRSRATFTLGTNMKGWAFMILRNQFYSEKRRSWRRVPLDQETAESTLLANDDPTAAHELSDLRRAMMLLSAEQREALILVGAAGMPYDEAASILGCAIGTVKSRVSRARRQVGIILAAGQLPAADVAPHLAFDAIIDDAFRHQAVA
ncbi:sigma-70 family RNA polymerase sigma factor [Phenylobacterium montanum]|uniref:Sigma-70 family RNA polymerase sigma factor n=1 Tax=Phenylobacterium montanum TaxID=2823693 RepID=A0A975G1P9_9CAUL|nr:sigma-70 family RNA polymerase sigma factor [Caulobacter sp. S6]QUD89260.1 sigma-70 family RNA polymerase sigma factor [Caulobacter sp. S6]